MKLFKTAKRNPGDQKDFVSEEKIEDIKFNIYKLNGRQRPKDSRQILVVCCFSEFGCETVGATYCIPRIMRDHPSKYKIIVGWYGREYLYRHLADEFWEVKQEHMWLREHARAFHYESKNLEKTEDALNEFGVVVPSAYLGKVSIAAKCFNCLLFYNTYYKNGRYDKSTCPRCKSSNILNPIFGDVNYWKPRAVRIPEPSLSKQQSVKKYLGEKPVAIFARARKCYGRNLQPSFYEGLIALLRSKGYDPIWMGEKVSTLPCPVSDVIDFSRMDESKDLESTFAIIKQCKFTVQFWTASSRLAGLMGVPYLLFESPDQIWGYGQEGIRRNLCDFGPRKLSINHYLNVYQNNEKGLKIVKENIEEMEEGNWDDHIGLVEDEIVRKMKKENDKRIGDLC
jgi:predicted Zn-ribbon and HTH transcriptional regulator